MYSMIVGLWLLTILPDLALASYGCVIYSYLASYSHMGQWKCLLLNVSQNNDFTDQTTEILSEP